MILTMRILKMNQFDFDISPEHLPLYPNGARLNLENDKYWVAKGTLDEVLVFITVNVASDFDKVEDIFEGLSVFVDPRSSGKRFVCRLEDSKIADKFLRVMSYIAFESKSINDSGLLKFLLSKLNEWSAFLKPKKIGISEAELLGVYGELYVLLNYLIPSYGLKSAIQAYWGPKGASQDFGGDGFALEVKTTLKKSPENLRISSLSQLEHDSGRVGLYLLQLDLANEGLSVNDLVALIEENLESEFALLMTFRELVNEVIGTASDEQLSRCFSFNRERFWKVAENFPVLTHENIPEGIVSAEYSINISSISEYLVEGGVEAFLNE